MSIKLIQSADHGDAVGKELQLGPRGIPLARVALLMCIVKPELNCIPEQSIFIEFY